MAGLVALLAMITMVMAPASADYAVLCEFDCWTQEQVDRLVDLIQWLNECGVEPAVSLWTGSSLYAYEVQRLKGVRVSAVVNHTEAHVLGGLPSYLQYAEVKLAEDRLARDFKDRFTRVLSVPYWVLDDATIDVARELGYRAVIADKAIIGRPALVNGVLYLPAVTPNETTAEELERSPGIVLVVHPWDVPAARRLLATLLQKGEKPVPLPLLIERLLKGDLPEARLPDYATVLRLVGYPANPVEEVLQAWDRERAARLVAQWLEAITLLRALDPLVPHRLTPTIRELARHAINEPQLHAMIHYWDPTAALIEVSRFRSLALKLLHEVVLAEREVRKRTEERLARLAEKLTELERLVDAVGSSLIELNQARERLSGLERRLAEVEEEVARLQADVKRVQAEVSELGRRVDRLENQRKEGKKKAGKGPVVPVIPPTVRRRRPRLTARSPAPSPATAPTRPVPPRLSFSRS